MKLDNIVDFTNCPIDPAPFQLMEGSSLLKVFVNSFVCNKNFNLLFAGTQFIFIAWSATSLCNVTWNFGGRCLTKRGRVLFIFFFVIIIVVLI